MTPSCIIFLLLSEVLIVKSVIKVTGRVGGTVKITCSHWVADGNSKYFCRDPCNADKHILIKSGQISTSKYRLKDLGKGTFHVTITDLQTSDSGVYWCGVDRWGIDTFLEVHLRVIKAPHTSPSVDSGKATPTTALLQTSALYEPSISMTTTISPSTTVMKVSTQNSVSICLSHIDILQYMVAGLVAIVILFGMSMITLYMCRRKMKESQNISSVMKTKTANNNNHNKASSYTAEHHEESMENPLYDSATELRRDSHIYSLAQ